mgnify:CR=1 FL=1
MDSTLPSSDEQWVSVRGNNRNIWPRLRNHLTEQGYGLELDDAEKMIRLLERLEDLDDVQNVYSNADISEEILAKLG